MTRYIAVPVDFRVFNGRVRCDLKCCCITHEPTDYVKGWGSTEDEAFSDLLAKLGYEEAKK